MDNATVPGLFVNDGSFLERFKQLQQEKDKKTEAMGSTSKSLSNTSLISTPKTIISKTKANSKRTSSQDTAQTSSGGKLAFSLKQKSKLVSPPVRFEEDEDDKENGRSSDDGPVKRAKLNQMGSSDQSSKQPDNVPPSPSDPTVKKVADKLASFVAKNGRQFEHVTRQKNPGDTPFKFLYDNTSPDYKYYEYRLSIEEKEVLRTRESQSSQSDSASHSSSSSHRSHYRQPNYQTPVSALHESSSHPGTLVSTEEAGKYGESFTSGASDPLAMMEYYMKKAAQEEKRRPPKASKDEMPPPESLQAPKKGHHMGDYIPPEELEKFLATCNDVSAQKYAKEYAEKAKIQADNVGHRLLSKMGWKEGEGLGSSRSGIADPIMAGDVKKDNLGVGAHAPGEVTAEDDIYEQYKKRMMLGYRYRPNPLNNPRKAYY